jgi:hypothetical protein
VRSRHAVGDLSHLKPVSVVPKVRSLKVATNLSKSHNGAGGKFRRPSFVTEEKRVVDLLDVNPAISKFDSNACACSSRRRA